MTRPRTKRRTTRLAFEVDRKRLLRELNNLAAHKLQWNLERYPQFDSFLRELDAVERGFPSDVIETLSTPNPVGGRPNHPAEKEELIGALCGYAWVVHEGGQKTWKESCAAAARLMTSMRDEVECLAKQIDNWREKDWPGVEGGIAMARSSMDTDNCPSALKFMKELVLSSGSLEDLLPPPSDEEL